MDLLATTAELRHLREQPQWRLLAADKAPLVLALLKLRFEGGERRVSASLLHERIGQDLQALRAAGEDLPRTPQAYVADWLAERWIARRLPAGAAEEEYELTADGAAVLRFVAGLASPRTAATESRLSVVIDRVNRLATETDPDPSQRAAVLDAERARLDAEIASLRRGEVHTLDDTRAVERAREIVQLADELSADFRRVAEEFEGLNRSLRERLLDTTGGRSEVLESLFAGVDLLAASPAGRTFAALWRLLSDPVQKAVLEDSLAALLGRPFAQALTPDERRFLKRLTATLVDEAGNVQQVLQGLARSLRHFVESREYLEQRRLAQVLREAQAAALQAKDAVRPATPLAVTLPLTSGAIRSVGQWQLYDPATRATTGTMEPTDAPTIDIAALAELLRRAEIDLRSLRRLIRDALGERAQVSIGELLAREPARQGLGTIVGYVSLGCRHGERTTGTETVEWIGLDGEQRRARIPRLWFTRERVDELRD
jgi:hypothetical protein